MTKYRNNERDSRLDAELEAEEAEYRRQYGNEPVVEEEIDPPASTKDEEIWRKRHSDLRSYTQKQINERDAKIQELERALTTREKEHQLPQNKQEVEQWVREYPDLARVLGTLIDERAEKQVLSVSDEVNNVKMQLAAERESIQRERAMGEILRAHPDFLDLIKTTDFQEWVESQPAVRGPTIGKALYDALYENNTDADAAIQAVNIYKSDKDKTKRANSRNDAALSVRKTSSSVPASTSGKRMFTESEIEAMPYHVYDKFEQEIEDARREGRITYDISGAAR